MGGGENARDGAVSNPVTGDVYWLEWGGAVADPVPTLPDRGFDPKYSGWCVTYCDVALDGGERVRPE